MKFQPSIKKLPKANRFYAAISHTSETISSDFLLSRLMSMTNMQRKDLKNVISSIREMLAEELAEGNSVEVFGLVKLTPEVKLKKAATGTEQEVRERLSATTAKDLKYGCRACIGRQLLYDLKKEFRASMSLTHVTRHGASGVVAE